uniref:trypsin n=1 Tax=Phlebotomus papatasi TaxID=29031 RepID=Q7Z0G1_PHLPP|nr:trypsin 3 [Phlebotomus papatasi]
MFRLVIVCALIVAVLGASVKNLTRPRLDGRIVGGIAVDISEVPYQVSLQRYNSHSCGGSIISSNYILTAAHCTDQAIVSSLSVRAGSSFYSRGGVVVGVKRVIQHPLFNYNTIDYDFAILELKSPLKFSKNCNFAKLPKQDEQIPDGTMLMVSGWGNTQNAQESRDQLRAAKVPKYNDKACNDAYKGFGGITDRMICAGVLKGGKDACQGDSGGPLTWDGVVVGVVSWGYGCAKPRYPGVYSRVSAVRDWIKESVDV